MTLRKGHSPELTDEQRLIVAHDHGPALVFAVAGAGKTTTMVHRIARLVDERVFTAESILATSFSRAAVDDIRKSLDQWPNCRAVRVQTLHALGYQVIRQAVKASYIDNEWLTSNPNLQAIVLARTIGKAFKDKVSYRNELDALDREDLDRYISTNKGNLRYANLDAAGLPERARKIAKQAEAPASMPWYLDLYRRYEKMRREMHVITYDDMLMLGWELLVTYDDLLAEMHGTIRTVMVDEFQDVNLAQAEILDLLVAPHGNYMVIGDDDQTIYEWRGASPRFILDFHTRYNAHIYHISDNFRSKASHVALANTFISLSHERYPKEINLTQGFGGFADISFYEDDFAMAWEIAVTIEGVRAEGYAFRDIAVLIRTYGQTPQIEFYLVEKRIPYRVIGSSPFYQRSEIEALIYYLRLAGLQRKQARGEKLDISDKKLFNEAWKKIYNTPKRYFRRDTMERIGAMVTAQNVSLCDALVRVANDLQNDRIEARLFELAELIDWLAEQLVVQPADALLNRLDDALQYRTHLRRSSGFVEIGEERARNVEALFRYAVDKGTGQAFLEHIDYLSAVRIGVAEDKDAVSIMTVFRAKGLEWPAVIVPGCNDGTFPLTNSLNSDEERRLFYVAMTRAKERLYLCAIQQDKTAYLDQTDYVTSLPIVATLRNALEKKPTDWETSELLELVKATTMPGFARYFEVWWPKQTPLPVQIELAERALALLSVIRKRGLSEVFGFGESVEAAWERYGLLEEEPASDAFPELEEIAAEMTPTTEHEDEAIDKDVVFHGVYGRGRILERSKKGNQEIVTVDFQDIGVKRISAAYLDSLN